MFITWTLMKNQSFQKLNTGIKNLWILLCVTGWGGKLVGIRRVQGFSKTIYSKLKSISKQYSNKEKNKNIREQLKD